MKTQYLIIPLLFVLIVGCSDDSTSPGNDIETAAPAIVRLSAEKTQILYGGEDPAIITCDATGGNLKYVWEVDLGDIIPMNSTHSKISYNGSACCVGEKTITCTVSNSLGTTSKSIMITILEELREPEIITFQVDKTSISAGAGEQSTLLCFAVGGSLTYSWATDCGELVIDETDNSKVTYLATADCVGTANITCTVTNEKGEHSRSTQISVVN